MAGGMAPNPKPVTGMPFIGIPARAVFPGLNDPLQA